MKTKESNADKKVFNHLAAPLNPIPTPTPDKLFCLS